MKKGIFVMMASLLMTNSFAQSEKYLKAMEGLVPAVDTTRSMEGLTDLANAFERIANAEKTQWLPFYYAALCNINIANSYFLLQQPEKIDPLMDKAEPMMNKAEALEKNNAEIMCLKKMSNSGKMMADTMNRFMIFGQAASEALETAKSLNPATTSVYPL